MRALNLVRTLWPLLVLLVLAGAVDVVLILLDDGWSATEWASNLLFAFGLTVVTLILGRRQGQIQEASAATDLIEKISAAVGALDEIRASMHASTVRQLLTDIRAGLCLYPLASPAAQREYVSAAAVAIDDLAKELECSVRPYSLWTQRDWTQIGEDARKLSDALREIVPEGACSEIVSDLDRLESNPGRSGSVPFVTFERSFRSGDLGTRVRVLLDWNLLGRYVMVGQAEITVLRATSHDWLRDGLVYAPWYVRADGAFAEFSANHVRPLTLNEIDDVESALPADSKERIATMQRWLASSRATDGGPPIVEIVTIVLKARATLLVLDGNHRLAAIYRARRGWQEPVAARIVEYRICAPLEPDLIPDLAHHDLVETSNIEHKPVGSNE